MTDEHLSVAIRALLGNQTQILNGLATLLHDGNREEFAKITLNQAEFTQRLCDGLDRVYGTAGPYAAGPYDA